MKTGWSVALCGLALVALAGVGAAEDPVIVTSKVLSQVPAYNWYHGCGPTAAGSIIGYYDVHGFDNLFTASGWDNVRLTWNVQDQISSPAHNAKYDPTPDDPNLPVPPNTSIACWFRTSVDPGGYGWSYLSDSDDAFVGYVTSRGYQCTSWYERCLSTLFSWSDFLDEIDAERPMLFLVDVDGDNATDHFVPAFGYGYDDVGTKYYACYTTWSEDETVEWREFRKMNNDRPWGIGYATYVHVVPEPLTLLTLALGSLAGLTGRGRRRRAA